MRKSPRDNFMFFESSPNGLQIVVSRDGQKITHALNTVEKEIYLSAIEKSQRIKGISEKLDISTDDIRLILDDFEKKGLILYSSDRESFLSLATESKY
jgi:DNA-binding MarR family transcriptional regulator